MKLSKLALVMTVSLAVAGAAHAQRGGRGQQPGAGPQSGAGPQIDVTQTAVVDGVVVSFTAGTGQGMPELVVEAASGEQYTFVLGPYWYLTSQGFSAGAGDAVTVTAYVCDVCDTGYAVATVDNITAGVTLTLRDEAGLPLWAANGPGGGNGQGRAGGDGSGAQGANGGRRGPGAGGPAAGSGGGQASGNGAARCDLPSLDLTRVATFAGTVASFTLNPGTGAATLVLATDSGDASFQLAPASILIRAGFAPAVGTPLTVTAAPATVDAQDVWFALTVTDGATALEIVLRDPATGLPIAGHARRGRS